MAGGVMGDYFFFVEQLGNIYRLRKPQKLFDVWAKYEQGFVRVPGTRGTYKWDNFYGALEAQFDMYLYTTGVEPKEVAHVNRIVCRRKPKKMSRRGAIKCYMHNLGYELK